LSSMATSMLLFSASARAETADIDWTDPHQEIDGFGAADAQTGGSMSSSNQQFFFGTGAGQLGLSLLRVGVTDDAGDSGDCSSISMIGRRTPDALEGLVGVAALASLVRRRRRPS
jgi:O-glycosyl hydrolase